MVAAMVVWLPLGSDRIRFTVPAVRSQNRPLSVALSRKVSTEPMVKGDKPVVTRAVCMTQSSYGNCTKSTTTVWKAKASSGIVWNASVSMIINPRRKGAGLAEDGCAEDGNREMGDADDGETIDAESDEVAATLGEGAVLGMEEDEIPGRTLPALEDA
jgi:hypothetical protein